MGCCFEKEAKHSEAEHSPSFKGRATSSATPKRLERSSIDNVAKQQQQQQKSSLDSPTDNKAIKMKKTRVLVKEGKNLKKMDKIKENQFKNIQISKSNLNDGKDNIEASKCSKSSTLDSVTSLSSKDTKQNRKQQKVQTQESNNYGHGKSSKSDSLTTVLKTAKSTITRTTTKSKNETSDKGTNLPSKAESGVAISLSQIFDSFKCKYTPRNTNVKININFINVNV